MNEAKQKYFDCYNVSINQKAYTKQGKQRIKTVRTTDCGTIIDTNENIVPEEEKIEGPESKSDAEEQAEEEKIELVELRKYWKKFLV